MLLLKWLWTGTSTTGPSPQVVFYTLRMLMFFLSFVALDPVIHDLSSRHSRDFLGRNLVASCFVIWTYQMHTFSNSIETLLVVWGLSLIKRIRSDKRRTSPIASGLLGVLVVFGTFNRITFPAFFVVPGLMMLGHFYRKPLSLIILAATALATLALAIAIDTEHYSASPVTLRTLFTNPIITPLNNLHYNLDASNLAQHGTHPRYQHLFINLPQLLGPAFILLFYRPKQALPLYSAISGVAVLSIFQHQEARFLLPCVPLFLGSIRLPHSRKAQKVWIGVWVAFNAIMGLLMGRYHQGGIVPMQFHVANMEEIGTGGGSTVSWWKTYSPPVWLLNGKAEVVKTNDLMGMKGNDMLTTVGDIVCNNTLLNINDASKKLAGGNWTSTYLVAPLSAAFLDSYIDSSIDGENGDRQKQSEAGISFEEVWRYRAHLNLDDMDFGDDGVWPTLSRVVGKRGLGLYRVRKECREET